VREAPKLTAGDEAELNIWLGASNKAGLTVPWGYIRRMVAKSWGILPREVDEEPVDEVLTEVKILQMESKSG
jgi:hypothetical protein